MRIPILSIKSFKNLWLGQAISQFGDAFYMTIFLFMVNKITGRIEMVGYAGALQTLPFLLIGPYAGVIADQIDRRKIMLVSDIVSAVILLLFGASLVFSETPQTWSLLTTPLLLSIARSFFLPAKAAAIPNLVPKDQMLKANSLSMATQNFMPLVSIAFSITLLALLYELSPTGFFLGAIIVNALSFLGSAWFIHKLPSIFPNREGEMPHPLKDVWEGVRYIVKLKTIAVLIGLEALLNLIVAPFFVVYIAANAKWFGDKPATLAAFEMSFMIGMIAGSALVGARNVRKAGKSFIFSCIVVATCIAALAISPYIALFIVWNIVAGLAIPFGQIPPSTYIQTTVEDKYLGRVNSALTVFTLGSMPLGMFYAGKILANFGVTNSFLLMGGGMLLVGLLGLSVRHFRNAEIPLESPIHDAEITEAHENA